MRARGVMTVGSHTPRQLHATLLEVAQNRAGSDKQDEVVALINRLSIARPRDARKQRAKWHTNDDHLQARDHSHLRHKDTHPHPHTLRS